MKKKTGLFFLTITAIFLSGCTPEPTLAEKKEITTRVIKGNYNKVYRSTMATFQDKGYVIKNTDMKSGLISAKADNASSVGYQVFQSVMSGRVHDKGSEIEIGAILTRVNNASTKVRINMNEMTYGQTHRFSGTSKQNVKQLHDKKLFDELFTNIQAGAN